MSASPPDSHRDPLMAGVLGIFPGLGHIYVGEPLRGATFFLGTLLGLVLFLIPGLILWAAGLQDAVACARRRNRLAPPLDHLDFMTITDGPPASSPGVGLPGPGTRPSDPWRGSAG